MMMIDPGHKFLRTARRPLLSLPLLLGAVLSLSGCNWIIQAYQSSQLRSYDSEINRETQAIANAHSDSERARAYSQRGNAYSEKARYGRAFKIIPTDEYERLFNLAVNDHNQAIALNPGGADPYYKRAQAYYARASLDLTVHQNSKPWFDLAAADFETTTQKDPRNIEAFDMLGLTHEQNGDWDKAVQAYSQELASNPKLGKARLADAWCGRGQHDQTDMDLGAAAADYEKSIAYGGSTDNDGCSCEPYNSLLVIYTERREYDKAWDFVHRAQQSKWQLDSELINQLKKASGRTS